MIYLQLLMFFLMFPVKGNGPISMPKIFYSTGNVHNKDYSIKNERNVIESKLNKDLIKEQKNLIKAVLGEGNREAAFSAYKASKEKAKKHRPMMFYEDFSRILEVNLKLESDCNSQSSPQSARKKFEDYSLNIRLAVEMENIALHKRYRQIGNRFFLLNVGTSVCLPKVSSLWPIKREIFLEEKSSVYTVRK